MGSGEGLEPGVFPRLLADTVDDGGGLLPFERLVVGLRADAFEILGVKKIVGAGAQKLFGLVAEQAPAGGADVDVAPVGLVQAHKVAHLLGEQPEAGLALAQRLLGSLALGDVPEGDNRADHRAAFPYGGARVFHGKVVPALRLKTSSLEECTCPVPKRRVDGALVLGVWHALCVEVADDVVLVALRELSGPVAQHPLRRRIDERGPLVEVEAVDALAHGGQYRAVLADQVFQVLLVLPRLRDVLNLGHDIERLAPSVAHDRGAHAPPDGLPALVHVALLQIRSIGSPPTELARGLKGPSEGRRGE
jgi:hypothetical protein